MVRLRQSLGLPAQDEATMDMAITTVVADFILPRARKDSGRYLNVKVRRGRKACAGEHSRNSIRDALLAWKEVPAWAVQI